VLGEEMQTFGRMDRNVHDLAVQIGALADQESLLALVDRVSALDRGCVACHSQFRDRLRAELR
jgi:cbb3-type cytochrome oxidase cytochrome c subunit